MLAKVMRAYRDRFSGSILRPGDEVDLAPARLEELSGLGFVEAAAGTADAAPDLAAMTNAQIAAYIASKGGTAPRKANKAALIAVAEAL